MLTPDWLMNPREDHTPPPADCFHLGEVWRSPRLKDWLVDKITPEGQARLRRAVNNRRTYQWRGVRDTGQNISNAWFRVSPPDEL